MIVKKETTTAAFSGGYRCLPPDAEIATISQELARARIKIELIELKGCEFFRNLARDGIKISLIELESVDFRKKLARPELKWAELMTAL